MSEPTLIFGIHAVAAFLHRVPQNVLALAVASESRNPRLRQIIADASVAGARIRHAPVRELDRISGGANHQGVVATVRPVPELGERDLPDIVAGAADPVLLLILDGVQDPHNLGACLRSADAAGAHAVVRMKRRSAPLNAAARKVASGAAETLPLATVTNLARSLNHLRDAGVAVVGAAADATDTVYETDLTVPVALVLGGEGEGMRRLTRECCDHLVRIPMFGSVESLNVSVSAGILLFEARRQRGH